MATSFDIFKTFVLGLKIRFGARAWAACLELSLLAEEAGRHHLHAYLMWTDGVGLDVRSLDLFYFDGLRPRVDVCTAKIATTSPHTAACHGLWYVSVIKAGTLQAETNYPPGQLYKPKARWLEGLFDDGKMELDKYIDAGQQPGNLQEVTLHETAVSWIRRREALNRMSKPWEETPEQFATRLKSVVEEINQTLNVEGLCRAFKQRVQKLVDRERDRITH